MPKETERSFLSSLCLLWHDLTSTCLLPVYFQFTLAADPDEDEDRENSQADFKIEGAFDDFSNTQKMYDTSSSFGGGYSEDEN